MSKRRETKLMSPGAIACITFFIALVPMSCVLLVLVNSHAGLLGFLPEAEGGVVAVLICLGIPLAFSSYAAARRQRTIREWDEESRRPTLMEMQRRGRCPKCKYELRGDYAHGCPECGWNRTNMTSK